MTHEDHKIITCVLFYFMTKILRTLLPFLRESSSLHSSFVTQFKSVVIVVKSVFSGSQFVHFGRCFPFIREASMIGVHYSPNQRRSRLNNGISA